MKERSCEAVSVLCGSVTREVSPVGPKGPTSFGGGEDLAHTPIFYLSRRNITGGVGHKEEKGEAARVEGGVRPGADDGFGV